MDTNCAPLIAEISIMLREGFYVKPPTRVSVETGSSTGLFFFIFLLPI